MCSGSAKLTEPESDMKPTTKSFPSSPLLEFAASDDVTAFKALVEVDNHPVDQFSTWYSRAIGDSSMAIYNRTPLMIAALYGSVDVISYIIANHPTVDVNRRSDSDGATALHLAAAGGAPNSLPTVKLLIESSADVEITDYSNRRPGDVISKQTSKSLETILKASVSISRSSSPTTIKEDDKKKEYPLDLTLPDIKNGIYGTDEFRMYTFKVKPCSRAYSHDWTECPFVHPGENARRRDPRKFLYSCVPCPEFRKGTCRNGDNCEYAHGVFECWLHPAQYRTRLCKDETGCNRRVCFFAHKREELRSVNPTAASVNGLGISSPRSELAAALMMGSCSPMSPSSSAGGWMNQAPPTLQMGNSRLKTTMSARDLDVDFQLLGLEGYQQKLFDEIQSAAAGNSPRSPWASNSSAASLAAASNLFGSSSASSLGAASNMFGSSSSQLASQTLTQQLLSGLSSPTLNSSSSASSSSSFGLDHSMARAIMNSRAASAFAKRSQSFIDRGVVSPRVTSGLAIPSATTTMTTTSAMGLSDWGSPNGKLDWGIQGEELNKLRKSASFGVRNNQSVSPPKAARGGFNEPDLSWVQPLVKDTGADMYSPWGEEQMVA